MSDDGGSTNLPINDATLEFDLDAGIWTASVRLSGSRRYSASSGDADEAVDKVESLLTRFPPAEAKATDAACEEGPRMAEAAPVPTSATERLADRTLDLLPSPEAEDGPPQDVILVASIIMLILKVCMLAWQFWKDGGKAVSICMKPNLVQRWYLKRLVRRVLKEKGMESQTSRVTAALLQMAKAVTVQDIKEVFAEAQADPETWIAANRLGVL